MTLKSFFSLLRSSRGDPGTGGNRSVPYVQVRSLGAWSPLPCDVPSHSTSIYSSLISCCPGFISPLCSVCLASEQQPHGRVSCIDVRHSHTTLGRCGFWWPSRGNESVDR